ncbi:post-GPI attachment to proteins factor 6-like [Cotesia glomerata]|uniref:EGF-like domain-containing protein n=1 Tax=Cotesia glomerata TaxID=32391 RepID=A0AAV7I7P0_COTGL|nr:post-GPI attachment to proteins factor 6-like [Cotesia glomerata]KAH0546206.1 hypothetical protein KQX54_007154 [Cotesia glomerata]
MTSVMLFKIFKTQYEIIIYIGLLLLSCSNVTSLMPEASQEGALHAFKSYSDVATFHYTVPKEVYRATWQFAAFMDGKNCVPREVHIYLQWGSYPVITANNESFPPNMYPARNDTIKVTAVTAYDFQTTTIVPVNSPEPGDWFVGAYMSHWDEKVQQEGIGHKCHYSIGSVAVWLQANGIQSIPIGHENSMTTSQSSTYYKIFIPSGTWTFDVKIWDCKFKIASLNKTSKNCIKGLALQGRTMPVFNHTNSYKMKNLPVNTTHTFTERTPHDDSYYYLLVVSDSIVEFNVKVSISECPIKITENALMHHWVSNISINYTSHQLMISDKNSHGLENENKDDPCPRRFQLIRVKQIQTFSGVYLFQGREWLTPWILLTDNYPVIAQFNILPLVDVGGSLDVGVHLEVDKFATQQQVIVIACVRRSQVPDRHNRLIVCHDNRMMMNLSSTDRRDAHLLIPYPQPDTWHVALQTRCLSNGKVVACDINEILVSLNIHTRQCVFSGSQSCGNHGICEEIHRGLLHYTTCSCFGGYKGWGCTDDTNVNIHSSLLMSFLMLILSNGFFLPAIYLAIKRKLYTESLVYFSTMLFSSLYHACDQKFMTYCIANYEVLQYCDFFSSILAFWVTLVAIARLPLYLVPVCHMFGVFIIAFCVESNKTGLTSILVPLAIGIVIPIGSLVYNFYKLKIRKLSLNLLVKLFIGLGLASIGLLLFTTVETEANYQYTHSMWHVIIALSLIFLLPPTAGFSSSSSAIESSSGSDSELVNLKNHSDSPVFTINLDQESSSIANENS